jgi:hypothetical protein
MKKEKIFYTIMPALRLYQRSAPFTGRKDGDEYRSRTRTAKKVL